MEVQTAPPELAAVPENMRIGVLFSGGPAPGANAVVAGLSNALVGGATALVGFANGFEGLISPSKAAAVPVSAAEAEAAKKQGGFGLDLGTSRAKLDADGVVAAAARVTALRLDGLVVIGGDDSATNAARLAEALAAAGAHTAVVAVPKTIDNDNHADGSCSFGFDTASRLISQLVGNLCADAKSVGKYWHFVRVMGRASSHIALEVALQTNPDIALVSEDVAKRKLRLSDVVEEVAAVVRERASHGKRYGVVVIPEGLVLALDDLKQLVDELNTAIARGEKTDNLADCLSRRAQDTLQRLTPAMRREICEARDPHGNLHLSHVEIEGLLAHAVAEELGDDADRLGFSAILHSYGYDARSSAPSRFDEEYGYSLGRAAAHLIAEQHSGYLVTLHGLSSPSPGDWRPCGVSLTSLMVEELRAGKRTPVVRKVPVDVENGKPWQVFASRFPWGDRSVDHYLSPSPLQPESAERAITLQLELHD